MDEIENWEALLEVLEQFEWTLTHQVEGGTIFSPSAQLEQALADSDWNQSDWYFEEPPEGVERYSLLRMNWESDGAPTSFHGFLELLQVGDEAAYVLYELEEVHSTPKLLGKVVPAQTPAAYRKLFLELMSSDANFVSLPDYAHIGCPDLLDKATVRQGFGKVIQRINGQARADLNELASWSRLDNSESATDDVFSLSRAEIQSLLDRYYEKTDDE